MTPNFILPLILQVPVVRLITSILVACSFLNAADDQPAESLRGLRLAALNRCITYVVDQGAAAVSQSSKGPAITDTVEINDLESMYTRVSVPSNGAGKWTGIYYEGESLCGYFSNQPDSLLEIFSLPAKLTEDGFSPRIRFRSTSSGFSVFHEQLAEPGSIYSEHFTPLAMLGRHHDLAIFRYVDLRAGMFERQLKNLGSIYRFVDDKTAPYLDLIPPSGQSESFSFNANNQNIAYRFFFQRTANNILRPRVYYSVSTWDRLVNNHVELSQIAVKDQKARATVFSYDDEYPLIAKNITIVSCADWSTGPDLNFFKSGKEILTAARTSVTNIEPSAVHERFQEMISDPNIKTTDRTSQK